MIFRTQTLPTPNHHGCLFDFHSTPSVWGSTPVERAKAGHLRLQRCNSRWGRTEWCVKLPHQQLVDILPVPVKVHARRIALAAFWALACQSPSAEAQAPGVKAAGSLFLHTAAPTRVPHVAVAGVGFPEGIVVVPTKPPLMAGVGFTNGLPGHMIRHGESHGPPKFSAPARTGAATAVQAAPE